jgi:peptidoglycan/xylan/chitin deacetylase (PgdA/CDA1 family)
MSKIRVDRFVTLGVMDLFRRLPRASTAIPILMYHSISSDFGKYSSVYYETTTHPRRFEEHMRLLHEEGYSTASLDVVVHGLRTRVEEPRKIVAITFDDGFRDFYKEAYPVLARYGFMATMFIPTACVGKSVHGRACMNWDEVRELNRAGIMFGSHTATHPQLHSVNGRQRFRELRESKDVIEQSIGTRVDSFSYPYAFPEQDRAFTAQLKTDLLACGYKKGVSTIVGRATPKDEELFLRRLPANDADDASLLKAKLSGAYDWVHTIQYTSKVIRWEMQKWRHLRPSTT